MRIKNYIIPVLLFFAVISSCKKTESELPSPILTVTASELSVPVNFSYPFAVAKKTDKDRYSSEWTLNGKIVSTSEFYLFKPTIAGNYQLTYKAINESGTFSHLYQINVPVPVVNTTSTSSKFISKIFEYLPAPGQFINETSLGVPAQAQKIVGSISNTVSLGAFGGYIIFGFDHSVNNQEGYDLAVYGNPSGGTAPWAEHGIVMVSQDRNGNGLPDDEWFELAGSEYNDPSTIKNYEITYQNPKGYANVTWTDNQGNSGSVDVNAFHRHNFYPEFASNQEKITFKGTLLKSTFGKTGSLFINSAFNWGYADSWSLGDDYQTNRYNSFDISWAVDHTGKKVELKTIDFFKVYTAQSEKGSPLLGEISTEFKGASDLNLK